MKVLFYTLAIVIIDQVTKVLVKGISIPFLNINYTGMYHGQRIEIFGDFFRFTFIENPGMAFGVDPGSELKIYLSLFSLIASIGLLIYMYKIRHEHFSTRISLAFILGGAIGNLIDRMFYGVFYSYAPLFYGKVVDFLDFDFFDVSILGRSYDRFPIFNIADSAVTIGVILLLVFYNNINKKEEETLVETTEPQTDITEVQNTDETARDDNHTPKNENVENRSLNNDEPDNGKELPL